MKQKPIHLNPYKIKTSKKEITDLIKAWVGISLAFGIVLRGQFDILTSTAIAAIGVGTGFLFHEMAHKLIAQKYRCWAEFRSFDFMIFIAIIMSFLGFVFAAPGAVMIRGHINKKQYGKISAAGPGMNLLVAIIFIILQFTIPLATTSIWNTIFTYGIFINTWLGLFNLIPFGNFDGKKILRWNKTVYGFMVGIALIMFFLTSTGI